MNENLINIFRREIYCVKADIRYMIRRDLEYGVFWCREIRYILIKLRTFRYFIIVPDENNNIQEEKGLLIYTNIQFEPISLTEINLRIID